MKATILCIDDDREASSLITEELSDRGYAMVVENDGEAGLEAILRLTPDLVLCGIDMPGLSGFEVRRRLLAVSMRYAAIPFVFLTAFADRESRTRARSLDIDAYVLKPMDFEHLDAAIRRCLDKRPAGPPRRVDAVAR